MTFSRTTHHTINKILKGEQVSRKTLAKVVKQLFIPGGACRQDLVARQLEAPKGEAKVFITGYSALTFLNTLVVTFGNCTTMQRMGTLPLGEGWCP